MYYFSAFRAIWGSSATDVFAVGATGEVVHLGATGWSPMASNTNNDLNGVWGSSGTDVFVVGAGGTIIHYGPPAARAARGAMIGGQ